MATRIETWIEEQRRLVEMGGQTAYSFLLEGPDGKTWATFPAGAPELVGMVNEAQRGLEAQLAAGQTHSAKWVSMDAEGRQLACLPCVLRGQSNEAAGAAKDTLAFTRATSQHLLASEALVTMYKNLAERLGNELEEERQENAMLREALVTMRDTNFEAELERTKALNDERRFDSALEELKPLLGIATNIVGEKVVKWVKEAEEEKERAKKRRRRKPDSANGRESTDAGAGASGTTPETRLALHAQSAGSKAAVRSNGSRGNNGAGQSHPGRNGAARNGAVGSPPKKRAAVRTQRPVKASTKRRKAKAHAQGARRP